MANYTKSFNFRNGVQVDDGNFVISPDGLVGIGTSQPNKELDVYGNSRVSGIASFNHIGVVGIVTIGDNIELDSGTGTITATSFSGNLTGATGIVAIATAGWIQQNVGLTTMGNVGIGTTEFNHYELQVGSDPVNNVGVAITEGVLLVSGLTTTNDFCSSGVSTFFGNINADADVDIDGHTELDDVNVAGIATFNSHLVVKSAGVTTFYNNLASDYSTHGSVVMHGGLGVSQMSNFGAGLNVIGHTELDDVNISGFSTFNSNVDIDAGIDVDGHTELDDVNVSGASTFTGAIDANGDLDVDGHTELDDVNVSGASTFVGVSKFNSEVSIGGSIFVSGISTFKDDVEFHGVAGVTSAFWDKSENKFIFNKGVKLEFDDADGAGTHGLEISHDGTNSLIQDYGSSGGTGKFTLKTSNSTFEVFGNNTESMIVANPNADVQLFNDNVLQFNTISTGASVYGQINVASLNGGTDTLSTKHGALRYGNESSTFGYSTRKSLDLLNYDTGNINFYLDGSNTNSGIGSFHWHKGPDSPLMTLNAEGNLGIGITEPEYRLHVSGVSTFSSDVTAGNNLLVANDLTVGNDLTVSNTINANISGNVTGYLLGDVVAPLAGISTFYHSMSNTIGIGTTGTEGYPFRMKYDDGEPTSSYISIDENGYFHGLYKLGVSGQDASLAAINFKNAGAASNIRFMIPPTVTDSQRTGLSTDGYPGALIYNSSINKLQFYNGTAWETVTSS